MTPRIRVDVKKSDCIHCGRMIAFDPIDRYWFHVSTLNCHCVPGGRSEPFAEPSPQTATPTEEKP